MNFCCKCSSYYTQPGTCNCFAELGTAPLLPDNTGPWVPDVVQWPPQPYRYEPWDTGTWPNGTFVVS